MENGYGIVHFHVIQSTLLQHHLIKLLKYGKQIQLQL